MFDGVVKEIRPNEVVFSMVSTTTKQPVNRETVVRTGGSSGLWQEKINETVDFRKFMVMFVLVVALTLVVQAASPKDAFVKDVALQCQLAALSRPESLQVSPPDSPILNSMGRIVLLSIFMGSKTISPSRRRISQSAGVTRVRTSYFTAPDRTATRIVFDLDKTVNYRVIDDGAGVVRVVFDAP